MKLSVVIPVYNEVATLPQVLDRVALALPDVDKEIIIVDDGSQDGTRDWLRVTFDPLAKHQNIPVNVILHDRNRGKGAALRTGFSHVTGDVIVIQDADLEYNPKDWQALWDLIAEDWADVVYGSRFYGRPHRVLYFHHLLGNQVISFLVNLLCNTTLTDVEVCTKMFRREVVAAMPLVCNDFGFEVEFTIKMARAGRWRIYEVGIAYYGRTFAEGKKINWRDGLRALGYILRFGLWPQ
ncbi:MAG: glycosyltransferase family 2 protein [Gloeomargaritaceae cyanobacterium C42_A2020_066]|nr:glycosyltransferase family 2 protein [Gloeomargaritaceae cyanobacterium C42_A2020_066]